ncbi:23735_t:CDS:2, partial [Racocetra persica]
LRLSPTKCHFAKRELKFLDYVVSPDGVSTDPQKVEAVRSFPALKEKLTTAPVLAYPNFSQEFLLFTDASRIALGAILSERFARKRKGRLTCWILALQEYTVTVVCRAGKFHSNADSLSHIAKSSTTTPADF